MFNSLTTQRELVKRVVAAVMQASWRLATSMVHKLKELYILYDGRTPEACIQENIQFNSIGQTVLICAVIYLFEVLLILYLASPYGWPMSSKRHSSIHLWVFLAPIFPLIFSFLPIYR